MNPFRRPLILASASPVRAEILAEAGVAFTVVPSPYDEEAEKDRINHLAPDVQAALLARGKAETVSYLHSGAYVIGADQICAMEGRIFGKPGTMDAAISHLTALQGRTHFQHSAACVYRERKLLWEEVETVTLRMKAMDAQAIEAYLERDRPFGACGAYAYEKTGHTLFESVQGSTSAIKGLPLDGLLAFMRER